MNTDTIIKHHYYHPARFDWSYRTNKDELPDPQCFHQNEIENGQVEIQKVGITKLDFPINLALRNDEHQLVHGKVSAYVSLDSPTQRGINMSRLARCFYRVLSDKKGVDLLDFFDIVNMYKEVLPSRNAYLKVRFELPLEKSALREDHMGWLYYPVTLEIENRDGVVKSYISVTYVYSSACPCSKELAEYSTQILDTPSISHSQRSFAVAKIQFDPTNSEFLWIEDIIDMMRTAQPSELMPGIVTRVGEFSFAQLMAAEGVTGFVEDVLRRFYSVFNNDSRILDFVVSVDHQESLNQNHANGVIYKGIKNGLC